MSRPTRLATAVALILSVGVLMAPAGASSHLIPISGTSPYPDGGDPTDSAAVTACNGAPQTGVLYRNSETEPHLAVNPIDPDNMIAGWHQDRWSTGAAQGLGAAYTVDGGSTWMFVNIPFTRCSGAAPGSAGDFERASDPWISFGPDGTAYYMALVADDSSNENGMAVSRSTNGGMTWTQPQIIKKNPAQDFGASLFHDKNSITADPYDSNLVYATWTLFRNGVTSLVVARSTNGGATWGPAKPIGNVSPVAPSEVVFFRQGAQIVVLPDGTLVDVYYRILFDQKNLLVTYDQGVFRSTNKGKTWERSDFAIDEFTPAGAFDPDLGIAVRDASQLPDVAVDPSTGALYVTWQQDNGQGLVESVISRSIDGGFTWSAPKAVNQITDDSVQTFLPTVAVNKDGIVGVLFYDFRNDVLGDEVLSTDVHLSLFDPNLNFLGERTLTTGSFDMRQMVLTGVRGYFPGDYVGLDTAGSDFVAAFTIANNLGLPVDFPQPPGLFVDTYNRQDIVFVRETAIPTS